MARGRSDASSSVNDPSGPERVMVARLPAQSGRHGKGVGEAGAAVAVLHPLHLEAEREQFAAVPGPPGDQVVAAGGGQGGRDLGREDRLQVQASVGVHPSQRSSDLSGRGAVRAANAPASAARYRSALAKW